MQISATLKPAVIGMTAEMGPHIGVDTYPLWSLVMQKNTFHTDGLLILNLFMDSL